MALRLWRREPAPKPLQPAQTLHRVGDITSLRGAIPGTLAFLQQALQGGVGLEGHQQKRRQEGAEDTDEITGRSALEHQAR